MGLRKTIKRSIRRVGHVVEQPFRAARNIAEILVNPEKKVNSIVESATRTAINTAESVIQEKSSAYIDQITTILTKSATLQDFIFNGIPTILGFPGLNGWARSAFLSAVQNIVTGYFPDTTSKLNITAGDKEIIKLLTDVYKSQKMLISTQISILISQQRVSRINSAQLLIQPISATASREDLELLEKEKEEARYTIRAGHNFTGKQIEILENALFEHIFEYIRGIILKPTEEIQSNEQLLYNLSNDISFEEASSVLLTQKFSDLPVIHPSSFSYKHIVELYNGEGAYVSKKVEEIESDFFRRSGLNLYYQCILSTVCDEVRLHEYVLAAFERATSSNEISNPTDYFTLNGRIDLLALHYRQKKRILLNDTSFSKKLGPYVVDSKEDIVDLLLKRSLLGMIQMLFKYHNTIGTIQRIKNYESYKISNQNWISLFIEMPITLAVYSSQAILTMTGKVLGAGPTSTDIYDPKDIVILEDVDMKFSGNNSFFSRKRARSSEKDELAENLAPERKKILFNN